MPPYYVKRKISVALDADTGRLKWYHQYVPNDHWDIDTPMTNLLVTAERNGRRQPITFQANRTGFFFDLDRSTGQLVAAKRFARNINIWKDVDPETGKLIENAGMRPADGADPIDVCPSAWGAAGWAHPTYHPGTRLVYTWSFRLVPGCSAATVTLPTPSMRPLDGSRTGMRCNRYSSGMG